MEREIFYTKEEMINNFKSEVEYIIQEESITDANIEWDATDSLLVVIIKSEIDELEYEVSQYYENCGDHYEASEIEINEID